MISQACWHWCIVSAAVKIRPAAVPVRGARHSGSIGMFNVHGLSGRLSGQRAEALRPVARVRAPSRPAHIEGPGEAPLEEDAERVFLGAQPRPQDEGHTAHTPALQAYAQIQQGPAVRSGATPSVHLVAQWMSTPAMTLLEDQGLDAALALLHARGISQAPVLNPQGELVGLLLLQDLALLGEATSTATVHAWMRRPVPSADPSTDLRQLAAALIATGLPGLPVTDAAGTLLGYISGSDVLRAVVTEPPLNLWG